MASLRVTLVHTTQIAAAYNKTTSRCVASCFNSSKSIRSISDKLSSFSEDAEKKRMERERARVGGGGGCYFMSYNNWHHTSALPCPG